ncbi:MAG: tRNA uridine 5-carboxymethylaminomethyl modification enzyme MnmG [Chlamydiae bacterium]|nr:tRNA uridine 5-carboxymethylaminomethyl modification enzyme MnmG [Chlamydiota bacterium]
MWTYPKHFDLIVIGGGHAGCEAAYAAARMGASTLLLTMNLDTIGKMSCNPAIGGTAKGHMVREIDALGGIMGKVADRTGIQFRMLNRTKGPAVWSPRAQSDKLAYQSDMKYTLEQHPHLEIMQGTIESLTIEGGVIKGVRIKEGIDYRSKTVILSAGTFMRGLLHIGEVSYSGGRAGDKPSIGLSKCLEDLGFKLDRLKTGTPPRVNKRSIDYSKLEEQPPEEGVSFSFDPQERRLQQLSCFITYTNAATKKVILDNLTRSPLYSGKIKGVGPRYCPSIEDKFVRFSERERHQLFLEPEGVSTNEVYVNGISSSLPFDVQYRALQTIPGLENVEIMRPAYAIEYDYVTSGQLRPSLETKSVEGLFFAGQVNGTTGYEEAAAQGLMAGINATLKVRAEAPFLLKRSEAYIGVMIDDLISKDLDEPYRMFTSRAEYRLLLRQDNADLRLREYGYQLGLIDEEQYKRFRERKESIESGIRDLEGVKLEFEGRSTTLAKLLCRPEFTYASLLEAFPSKMEERTRDISAAIEIDLKYAGYINRERKNAEKLESIDSISIPDSFDFQKVVGLRNEAQEKLTHHHPGNLGQASRISGVSPADISILLVSLKR